MVPTYVIDSDNCDCGSFQAPNVYSCGLSNATNARPLVYRILISVCVCLCGCVLQLVLSRPNRFMNLGISKQQHLYLRTKKLI